MDEDDIEVEIKNKKGEVELRPYRANKYIKEYFTNEDNLVEYLFDKKIITYKIISEILKLTETVVKNAIEKETKNPQTDVRKKIHLFFNKDYYEELGKYAKLCSKCTKKCKQVYYVPVECKKYKAKK